MNFSTLQRGAGEIREFRRGAEGRQNPSLISLYERETSIPQKGVPERGEAPLPYSSP
jgi:hypothetical protein